MASPCIELNKDGIWINGHPLILLTSSLFYFRIPASEWRSRMYTLLALGYNAIDVYFPWNYHEPEPGQWNFSGERDVRAFLQLAKELGLWVIARPGPYICSEWDGGALPAYLNVKPGLKLRDNDPDYLQAVSGWYEHIMPILTEFQVEHGGPVVLVQIENELDFYDCADRASLMSTLQDLARTQGINVPLIACSGEGDLVGSTGGVDGIVPVCNVYFDSGDPEIEARIRHYDGLVRAQGYPLCIPETNRSHTDLRRLLAGGAKLLGPYLQTGGTNFGFTNGVTNWGDPLAFMTTHYDFGGMISPSGKVRAEGREAIILSKMLKALGPALALAAPVAVPPLPVHGIAGQALALNGSGWLLGLPNPSQEPVQVCFGESAGRFPAKTELMVAPNTCPFVLLDYPLSRGGMDGHIVYATAELVEFSERENVFQLTFAVDNSAEVVLEWAESALGNCHGWQVEPFQPSWRLWLESGIPAEAEFSCPNGKRLLVKAINRAELANLHKAGLEPWQIVSPQSEAQDTNIPIGDWRLVTINPCGADWFNTARPCNPGELHFEQNQLYRGFGWYRASFARTLELKGFLVRSGADVLSLYLDGQFLGTLVPGGADAYLSLPDEFKSSNAPELVVRAEIWGHANFDDHRLPALRLKSMRGMGGLAAIRKVENITPNWFYQHRAQAPTGEIAPGWPMLYFGGWSTTDEPAQGVYYREVPLIAGLDTRILYFPGLQVSAQVFINGQLVGSVNPFSPFVDISDYSLAGATVRIAVAVEQPFRRPTGEVLLYQGESLPAWELAGWGEAELAELAESSSRVGEVVKSPISLKKGEMAWLHAELPLSANWERGWGLQMAGRGLKVSAWIGKHLVGRIWLPSEMRLRMAGGADDRMVLPAQWLRAAEGKLHLLLESVGNQPFGELRELKFILDI